MAGNSNIASRSISATLVASTVDLVVLTDGGFGVQVENVSGTAPIYFSVSHPGGSCTVPSVAASTGSQNFFCAAAVAGAQTNVRHPGQFGSVVQLISTGTPSYTVSVTGSRVSG